MRAIDDLHKETMMLADYNCPAEHREEMKNIVTEFADDRIATNVLHNFYSFLPEAHEDGIRQLHEVAKKNGVFLICAASLIDSYLYLATMEKAELIGTLGEGIDAGEILEFFSFPDNDSFKKRYPAATEIKLYTPVLMDENLCPVCGSGNGEFHTPGCPVEICPWCGGQLTSCNCRFERSGQESLKAEKHLDNFLDLLEKKGRVPYDAAEHRPGYMSHKN